jgi:hypothetical protein
MSIQTEIFNDSCPSNITRSVSFLAEKSQTESGCSTMAKNDEQTKMTSTNQIGDSNDSSMCVGRSASFAEKSQQKKWGVVKRNEQTKMTSINQIGDSNDSSMCVERSASFAEKSQQKKWGVAKNDEQTKMTSTNQTSDSNDSNTRRPARFQEKSRENTWVKPKEDAPLSYQKPPKTKELYGHDGMVSNVECYCGKPCNGRLYTGYPSFMEAHPHIKTVRCRQNGDNTEVPLFRETTIFHLLDHHFDEACRLLNKSLDTDPAEIKSGLFALKDSLFYTKTTNTWGIRQPYIPRNVSVPHEHHREPVRQAFQRNWTSPQRKEVTPKEVTPKEVTPKEVTPKEVTPKEVTPKEVTPKEVTPKETRNHRSSLPVHSAWSSSVKNKLPTIAEIVVPSITLEQSSEAESVTDQPIIESVVESVVQSVSQPVVQSVSQPVVESVIESVVQSVSQPAKKQYVKKQPVKLPVKKQQQVETAVELVVETAAEPVVEIAVEPIVYQPKVYTVSSLKKPRIVKKNTFLVKFCPDGPNCPKRKSVDRSVPCSYNHMFGHEFLGEGVNAAELPGFCWHSESWNGKECANIYCEFDHCEGHVEFVQSRVDRM